MLFIFALPVMQVILFCLAIGRDPQGLNIAIVNGEMNDTVSFFFVFAARSFESLYNYIILWYTIILHHTLDCCYFQSEFYLIAN